MAISCVIKHLHNDDIRNDQDSRSQKNFTDRVYINIQDSQMRPPSRCSVVGVSRQKAQTFLPPKRPSSKLLLNSLVRLSNARSPSLRAFSGSYDSSEAATTLGATEVEYMLPLVTDAARVVEGRRKSNDCSPARILRRVILALLLQVLRQDG